MHAALNAGTVDRRVEGIPGAPAEHVKRSGCGFVLARARAGVWGVDHRLGTTCPINEALTNNLPPPRREKWELGEVSASLYPAPLLLNPNPASTPTLSRQWCHAATPLP